MEVPHTAYCTTVLPSSVKNTHLCQCGCEGELPPFVDYASRATRYLPGHFNRDLLQNFEIDEETDCWIWQGKPTKDGHGQINIARRTQTAHRWFYELLVGPVPDGCTLHHICDNKLCVNPDHLDVMTHAEHRRLHARAKWMLQHSDHSLRLIGKVHISQPAGGAQPRQHETETPFAGLVQGTPSPALVADGRGAVGAGR